MTSHPLIQEIRPFRVEVFFSGAQLFNHWELRLAQLPQPWPLVIHGRKDEISLQRHETPKTATWRTMEKSSKNILVQTPESTTKYPRWGSLVSIGAVHISIQSFASNSDFPSAWYKIPNLLKPSIFGVSSEFFFLLLLFCFYSSTFRGSILCVFVLIFRKGISTLYLFLRRELLVRGRPGPQRDAKRRHGRIF